MNVRALGAALAVTALATIATRAAADDPDFGSPPSGRIPIIFDDRHVYAKPDRMAAGGRVLAALIEGATVLVPLRSMFEEMDATVSYDAFNRTITLSKPGVTARVAVGISSVAINGDVRPLDVPPALIDGRVYVPLRVLSEAMGAYVQWLPDRRTVAIRYVMADVPPPAPLAPATRAPLAPAPPSAPPVRPVIPPGPPIPGENARPETEVFAAGDYVISPRTYDEFSPDGGGPSNASYQARAAASFDIGSLPLMVEGEYRQTVATHPAGAVTAIGNGGSTFVPGFTERIGEGTEKLGVQILQPRIFIGGAYTQIGSNTGYPTLSGAGAGLEKLPDLDQPFSVYGSAYFFPTLSGTCPAATCPGGTLTLSYRAFEYRLGVTYAPRGVPVFLDAGFQAERLQGIDNAPATRSQSGADAGIGLHF